MHPSESREQRRQVVHNALTAPREALPAGAWRYSNTGYVVAAAMLEARTGETWEHLMRQWLFEPLGMTSAGFGPPRPLPQPQGHSQGRPVGVGPEADNPEVLGPAGRVHASLEDWGKSRMKAASTPPRGPMPPRQR